MRTAILWAAAISAAVMGCAPSSEDTATERRIKDPSQPLIFLTHATEPPYAYTNATGEIVGTDVDLARAIAAKMGRKLICRAIDFEKIIPMLKAGEADFAISTITITDARRRDVDFSIPYASSGNCFLYHADDPAPRMSQISMLRVGVEPGTVQDIYLCRHGAHPLRYAHIQEAVAALKREEVESIFFDAPSLVIWEKTSGGKLKLSPLETREDYGVAVDKRRPDVLKAANAAIAERTAR